MLLAMEAKPREEDDGFCIHGKFRITLKNKKAKLVFHSLRNCQESSRSFTKKRERENFRVRKDQLTCVVSTDCHC
jgi:hypothetical protein